MQSILCFGDSNTWGLNPRDNSRFDDQTRWTGLLDDLLRPFGKRVIEEGLSLVCSDAQSISRPSAGI